MGVGSWIGDRLGVNVPILLRVPYNKRDEVEGYLYSRGISGFKMRASGNRGPFGIGRWLDVYAESRDGYGEVYSALAEKYELR